MASGMLITMPTGASMAELRSRSITIGRMGELVESDMPQSPVTKWRSQSRYWMWIGRSSPSSARRRASPSAVAKRPIIMVATSPGSIWVMKKIIREAARRVSSMKPRRRAMNLPTLLPLSSDIWTVAAVGAGLSGAGLSLRSVRRRFLPVQDRALDPHQLRKLYVAAEPVGGGHLPPGRLLGLADLPDLAWAAGVES